MNLLTIRTDFVKTSGRYDLVSSPTTFADNGADHYIELGQRYIESKLGIGPTKGKYLADLSVGDYLITLSSCRAIHSVDILTEDGKFALVKLTSDSVREKALQWGSGAYTTPIRDMDRQRPTNYYLSNLRRVPDDDTFSDSDLITSYLDVTNTSLPGSLGLVLLPPADDTYAIEVTGLFNIPAMSEDTDENYWAATHPHLLLHAALFQHDILYRGGKTSSTWAAIVADELMQIELDAIEQEIADINQMEG